jgi:hypothetical protein
MVNIQTEPSSHSQTRSSQIKNATVVLGGISLLPLVAGVALPGSGIGTYGFHIRDRSTNGNKR